MPVTASPEQLLAELEHSAQADGAGLDEIEAHVADALEVPRSYYFAYLLVRNAVEARCEATETIDPRRAHDAEHDSALLARAEALLNQVGAHAGELYRQTATGANALAAGCHDAAPAYRPDPGVSGPAGPKRGMEAADHASRILASVVTLRGLLRDAQPEQLPRPSPDVRRFESAGVVGRG